LIDLGYVGARGGCRFAIETLQSLRGERSLVSRVSFAVLAGPSLGAKSRGSNDTGGKVCYIGDGMVAADSRELFTSADLLLHEALILTHIQRGVRKHGAWLRGRNPKYVSALRFPGGRVRNLKVRARVAVL
jgi:hypothetical protein